MNISENCPVLYRGFTEPIPDAGTHLYISENRTPRYTEKKLPFQIFFNLMIERLIGISLIRRKVLFVSGNAKRVGKYASQIDHSYIGLVKPIGEFQYLYCPGVFDSAEIADELSKLYMKCFSNVNISEFDELIKNPLLTLHDLYCFFDRCASADTIKFDSVKSRILLALDHANTEVRFKYKTTDLIKAAESGVEILLFNCPSGYYIKPISMDIFTDLNLTCKNSSLK